MSGQPLTRGRVEAMLATHRRLEAVDNALDAFGAEMVDVVGFDMSIRVMLPPTPDTVTSEPSIGSLHLAAKCEGETMIWTFSIVPPSRSEPITFNAPKHIANSMLASIVVALKGERETIMHAVRAMGLSVKGDDQ